MTLRDWILVIVLLVVVSMGSVWINQGDVVASCKDRGFAELKAAGVKITCEVPK